MKSKPEMSLGSRSSSSTKHGVSKNKSRERDLTHHEMQALLSKLKELVPNMPKNKRLSKLEIIQYVIDYIVDLQIALETHPVHRPIVNTQYTTPTNRQPLGVISPSTNSVINTCATQEVSHTEKIPLVVSEVGVSSTKPVTC